ncbi:MAG: Fic family protein [Desulfobulbaceae bacterium]|nr:Fic family protein [Desulfobulbaceae bacterium]
MKEPDIKITKEILKLIAEIDEFKGQWKALGKLAPERLDALKKVATIESVGSSTRIEGAKLTDQEIEKLLTGIEVGSFHSRDEEEVAGYAEAMNLVFSSFREIAVTENHIKQLHSLLLKHSSKDVRHRGDYKKLSNNVEAFDQDGKSLGVIFETATPFDTPREMTSLVDWTNNSLAAEELHPLLIITVFIVHFLAIHPFQDGNGRLSRILTTLLLLQQGYVYVPYCSLESIIEQNKDGYYLSLRKAQKTLATDDYGLDVWLVFFIRSLKTQKDKLAKKIEREKIMVGLSELSEQILSIVKEHGRSTIADIEAITRANRNTIKVRLRELVADGFLVKHGKAKGTWYTKS